MVKFTRILFITFILILFALGYFYFFQLSPTFIEKPELEKPKFLLEEYKTIEFCHVSYILNELEAYKLHKPPFSQELPVIELYLEDTSQTFYAEVKDNMIIESNMQQPDVKIITTSGVLAELFESDTDEATVSAISKGKVRIEILSDEKTIALKGYKIIYDKLAQNAITGSILGGINPTSFVTSIELLLFLFFSVTAIMIMEKEI